MGAETGFMKQGTVDHLWAGCPSVILPEHAYGISDDFLEFSQHDTTSRWTVDSDTATAVLGSAETVGLGGVLVLAGSTDDKYINVKLSTADTGAPFKVTAESHKPLWFGIRVKNTVIDECAIYCGLCDQSVTQPFATTTGAENFSATQDGIYWRCLLNATKGDWDACLNHNGTETEVGGDLLTSDTSWHTMGITFDGADQIAFWGDDEMLATASAADATGPHDIGVTPFFGMILGETASKAVYVDWIKCVQLR